MSWNRRVVKNKNNFGVHEVYYNAKGEVTACTVFPMTPFGETEQELLEEVRAFLEAFNQPTLNYEDIDYGEIPDRGREDDVSESLDQVAGPQGIGLDSGRNDSIAEEVGLEADNGSTEGKV